ncbi:MAG: hypothetical protein JXB38_08680 [Anaerolineales bacterium]|nr:hypothetical protein [Anaerolineales bacterium]
MKISASRGPSRAWIIALVVMLLVACNPQAAAPSPTMEQPDNIPLPTQTPTPTQKNPPVPTEVDPLGDVKDNVTAWSPPTETPAPTLAPLATPVYGGTPLPVESEVIGVANVDQLANVAQWGRGSIVGVAYTPDGETFVVGSGFGLAVYDAQTPENPPRWVPFERPIYYESLYFSEDSNTILLEDTRNPSTVVSFPDGRIVAGDLDVNWLKTSAMRESWGELEFDSLDGQKQFVSTVTHDEEFWDFEFSIRRIYDNNTSDLLYELPDETIQVSFTERHEAEGCSLYVFSACGNAYSPAASHPYRVAFSQSGQTLAVLYRPPNLSDTNEFSTLRVYDGNNGELLFPIGSFSHPVETFAYSPDGNTLLLGYVDGLVQLWNIPRNTDTFTAQHFTAPLIDFAYSFDSKYLVVQRPEVIEVRLTTNGSLVSRFQATAFSLSPVANHIALGSEDGTLRVLDYENGSTIFNIQAHRAKLFTLAYSPDGTRLTSSGADCDVRNWDTTSGEFVHFFADNAVDAYDGAFPNESIFIFQITYIPGTDWLFGYGSWDTVVGWDVNSGATQYLLETPEIFRSAIDEAAHFSQFLRLDAEGQYLYLDHESYDLEIGKREGKVPASENLPQGCALLGPRSLDGDLLFTRGIGESSGQVCVLDAEDLHLIQRLQVVPVASKEAASVNLLSLSPKGDQLIANVSGDMFYVYQIVP